MLYQAEIERNAQALQADLAASEARAKSSASAASGLEADKAALLQRLADTGLRLQQQGEALSRELEEARRRADSEEARANALAAALEQERANAQRATARLQVR